MNEPKDPEAAETVQTTNAPAVDLPRFVRGWADLAEVPESETHYLEINVKRCNGWIREKGNEDALCHYLSTHTFYGLNHKGSTAILRKCGFNVTVANWDAPNISAQTPRREQTSNPVESHE